MPAPVIYWCIDDRGYLWASPIKRHATGRWEMKRFEGADELTCRPVWQWQSEIEGGDVLPVLAEITYEQATLIVSRHIKDAYQRRGRG